MISLFRTALCLGVLSTLALLCASPSFAWRTQLTDTMLPAHFVAVDKQRKKFFFYDNTPLTRTYEFTCTTGKNDGDKEVVGDGKTPEGIYFIEKTIDSGLDFKEYGGVAYTLNYPNPIDRLRGRTGHGIWIHSKGFGLVPTRGCVAIDLPDIAVVGPRLTSGTAVIIAEAMDIPDSLPPNPTAHVLAARMEAWANAWAHKSPMLFDFYDPLAYSQATENFSRFRAKKEQIFATISSLTITTRNIHVLEGPGYWVTWAEQRYSASNHQTEGIRRLYWQQDATKTFRIVAMEWIPQVLPPLPQKPMDPQTVLALTKDYTTYLATKDPSLLPPVHNTPLFRKTLVHESTPPRLRHQDATTMETEQNLLLADEDTVKEYLVTMTWAYQGQTVHLTNIRHQETDTGLLAQWIEAQCPAIQHFVDTWYKAWQKMDLARYTAMYDDNARQGKLVGREALAEEKKLVWQKAKPTAISYSGLRIFPKGDKFFVDMVQTYRDNLGKEDTGVTSLLLHSTGKNWSILEEDWKALP